MSGATLVRTLAAASMLLAAALPLRAAESAPPATVGDLKAGAVEVQPAARVRGGSAKAMENYRQFLNLQNTDGGLRAEALRRLGDLNLESGELERMASEVTQIDIQGAEAIRLYSTLLKAYPNYPRNDQVLYQLARAYETTGQGPEALATLDAIVARYPGSRDLAEVQFRRGELLFSAKRYAEAQRAYDAVVKRGPSGSAFYGQSLYKQGWSFFKQSMNEDSLQSFAGVLDLTLLSARDGGAVREWSTLGRADRELVEDTLRVMSITFSYLDGSKSLDEFLARRGRAPYAWLLYSHLGDLYVEKQRYQDAAGTYRAFLASNPGDAHAPALAMQAIEAYRKGGFADLMLDGKLEYVERFGVGTPFWQGRDPAAYPEITAELKTNLKDVAQHYHATAQKSKRLEDYGAAAHWYRVYLSSFPDDPDTVETNYLLADALFESRQYLESATEYERTAYSYPKGVRSAEAAYAQLVAEQKYEDSLAPSERAPVHARAVEASLRFAQSFPEHPESAVVLTRAAQDLFSAGKYAPAAQAAQLLLARTPPVDAAKQRIAWTIVGQVNFNQGAYDHAEAAFTQALSVAPPGDSERGNITERLADAVYKQAQGKRSAGDEGGAAEDFLRVARVAPGAKAVATAQYDAAAALINAKQWDRAITVLESYRRDYPKSEYSADITRKLAVAYEQAGRGAAAAAEYERIAANPAEDRALAREALTKGADLYGQAGNSARSVALLEQLVAQYPTPAADAIETRARLATLAAQSGNAERERYWQREIVAADASAGTARSDRTRYLAATAQLALVAPMRDAFRAVKLVAPLKKSLAQKKKALEAAVDGYKSVAAYQVAETTTAATYETAELYRDLARDLLASERPKKMTADEREQYDALLEEQAFPFEEQAIGIHELNAQRVRDGVYDDSVRKSFQALAELKPARYGKTERSEEQVAADASAGTAGAVTSGADVSADINAGLTARRGGDLAGAETALRRALERDPGSAIAWDELGITLRAQGKFSAARAAYQSAIVSDMNYAPAHRNLGVLLDLYLGDSVAALTEFERYRELSGEDKPVSVWVAELRQRTGSKAPTPAPTPAPTAVPAPTDNGGTT
jgi:tetratricopeptide (TPR) repeat protein